MPSIPLWLTGRGVSGCAIVPQTVGSDGALSDGSSSSLTGKLKRIELNSDPEQAKIGPMDATKHNSVILLEDNSVTLVEVMQNTGTTGNLLAAFANAHDVGKFTITRSGKTYTFYGRRGRYSEVMEKGECLATLTLTMLDTGGTANFAYANAS